MATFTKLGNVQLVGWGLSYAFSRLFYSSLSLQDCELGEETNPWAFSLLRNWLKAVFVPVNRRFSVLQSVLQSCNRRPERPTTSDDMQATSGEMQATCEE